MSQAPRFRRDPQAERRLLWGVLGLVAMTALALGMLVYFLGTSSH